MIFIDDANKGKCVLVNEMKKSRVIDDYFKIIDPSMIENARK